MIASRLIDAALLACGFFCLACGLRVPDPAPLVDCRALACPADAEAYRALDLFTVVREDFDPTAPLTIEWHAPGEVLRIEDGLRVLAETPSGHLTRVSSFALLAHELMHVHYWRTAGDGDGSHADPPGPWTAADDEQIADVATLYDTAGLSP